MIMNQTNDTVFSVEDVAPGVYVFDIVAFNVLGDGHVSSLVVTGE